MFSIFKNKEQKHDMDKLEQSRHFASDILIEAQNRPLSKLELESLCDNYYTMCKEIEGNAAPSFKEYKVNQHFSIEINPTHLELKATSD